MQAGTATVSPAVITAALFGLAILVTPGHAAPADVSACTIQTIWQDAYNRGDAAAVAALHAPDAIEVTPAGIRAGSAAVKQRVEQSITRNGMQSVTINATKCHIDGTSRWSAGDWQGATPHGSVGGFWRQSRRKDEGTWKLQI